MEKIDSMQVGKMDKEDHFDIVNLIHEIMINNDINVHNGITGMLHVICDVCYSSGVDRDKIVQCLNKMYDSIEKCEKEK